MPVGFFVGTIARRNISTVVIGQGDLDAVRAHQSGMPWLHAAPDRADFPLVPDALSDRDDPELS
jgi:hypothetical protein